MKKLYALIQLLLNKIILLEKKIKSLTDDLMEECYWHDCCREDRDELYKDNLKLQIQLDEWKKAFDERDKFWCKKFDEQKFWAEQMRLFMNNTIRILTDPDDDKYVPWTETDDYVQQAPYDDEWQKEMAWKYDEPTLDVEDIIAWDKNQEHFAEEIQEQKDWEYWRWVEDELGIGYEEEPEEWVDLYDYLYPEEDKPF